MKLKESQLKKIIEEMLVGDNDIFGLIGKVRDNYSELVERLFETNNSKLAVYLDEKIGGRLNY